MKALFAGDRATPWAQGLAVGGSLKPMKYEVGINRRALPETTTPDRPISYIDISTVDGEGRIGPPGQFTFESAPSRARRLPAAGDTIVSTVRTYLRAIAFVDKTEPDTVCSTGFALVTPGDRLDPRFLSYWLRSDPIVDEICARSVGVSYPGINASEIGCLPVPVLPKSEQRAIAAFLDRKTAVIDALIAKKERQIELLQEKRRALIAQAVTKGLDPNVPMKDSGVEWLGRIPALWPIVRVSYIATVQNGMTPSRERVDYWEGGTIPWISSSQVNDYVVTTAREFITERAIRETGIRMVPSGSVLIGLVGQGRTRGLSARMGISGCINQNVAAITPGTRMDGRFLHLVLRHAYPSIRELGRGGQQDAMNCEIIRSLRVPLPPLMEQLSLVDDVDGQHTRLDAAIAGIDRHVDLLREYRQALISAAVTGKIIVSAQEAA